MYSTLVSVALFSALAIQGALADFTVNTPEIVQCAPTKLTWDDTGAKSYNVIIVPNDDPCNGVLADLGDHTVNHITWTPELKEGAVVMVSVLDSNDQEGWSGAVTVKKGTDTSCLPASLQPSSSVAPSSTAKSSASAAVSPLAGTTLVVNPAAAPTSASAAPAAPSSSGAATAVGAANAGVLGGSNGAMASVKVSASALLLTLGAVAAIAL